MTRVLWVVWGMGVFTVLGAKPQLAVRYRGYLEAGEPAPLRLDPVLVPFDRKTLLPHAVPAPEGGPPAPAVAAMAPLPKKIQKNPLMPLKNPELPQMLEGSELELLKGEGSTAVPFEEALIYFKHREPLRDDTSVEFLLPYRSLRQKPAPAPIRSQATYRRH